LHEKEPEFGNKEEVVEVYERLMKHYERYGGLHVLVNSNALLTHMYLCNLNLIECPLNFQQ
jgi:hypothetical protein